MKHTHLNRFHARLALQGIRSVRAWSKRKGYNEKTVHAVLSGRLTGTRGEVAKRIVASVREEIAA